MPIAWNHELGQPFCHCTEFAAIGPKGGWIQCYCSKLANHDGQHYDGRRKHGWDGPVVYWNEVAWETLSKDLKKQPRAKEKRKWTPPVKVRKAKTVVAEVQVNLIDDHHWEDDEQRWMRKFMKSTLDIEKYEEHQRLYADPYFGEF